MKNSIFNSRMKQRKQDWLRHHLVAHKIAPSMQKVSILKVFDSSWIYNELKLNSILIFSLIVSLQIEAMNAAWHCLTKIK